MNPTDPQAEFVPISHFARADADPRARLVYSGRVEPAVVRCPVHLGRALLLFGLPLVPAAVFGGLGWWVHPFVGVAVAVGLYGAGIVALAVVMHASLQERQRERER